MATVNEKIDFDTAQIIVGELRIWTSNWLRKSPKRRRRRVKRAGRPKTPSRGRRWWP